MELRENTRPCRGRDAGPGRNRDTDVALPPCPEGAPGAGQSYLVSSADMTTPVPDTPALGALVWTGARFVAVGDGGAIVHSPDGEVWTAADAGVTENLTATTWTGDELVAISSNGTALTSPDATTWTVWPRQLGLGNLTGVTATAGRIVVSTRDGEISPGPCVRASRPARPIGVQPPL